MPTEHAVPLDPPCSTDIPDIADISDVAAGRDLTVDLLRAVATVLVVVGHWLVVVPSFTGGRFGGVNALGTVTLLHPLTWLFQVMPLFFAVGGYANAASWRSARRRKQSYATWLRARLVRLARPTIAFVATWVVAGLSLRLVGIDGELVATVGWLVTVPVWFLAVYVVVVALAPPLLAAHERSGAITPLVLVSGAAMVDWLRIAEGRQAVAYANFLFVFLVAQQLGFWWRDGLVARPAHWIAGGLGTLWLLTHVGPYPVSLVGVPGETIANNAPPTLTLVALGVAQVGVGVALRPWLQRLLRRPTVVAAAVALNLNAMTILLWHFTALAVTALVVLPLGVVPVHADGSPAWWVLRLVTVVALTPVLAGLVAVFGRVERSAAPVPVVPPTGAAATIRLLIVTVLLAAACSMIAVGGLSPEGWPLGLPLPALGLLVVAGAGLRGRPGQRTCSQAVADDDARTPEHARTS